MCTRTIIIHSLLSSTLPPKSASLQRANVAPRPAPRIDDKHLVVAANEFPEACIQHDTEVAQPDVTVQARRARTCHQRAALTLATPDTRPVVEVRIPCLTPIVHARKVGQVLEEAEGREIVVALDLGTKTLLPKSEKTIIVSR